MTKLQCKTRQYELSETCLCWWYRNRSGARYPVLTLIFGPVDKEPPATRRRLELTLKTGSPKTPTIGDLMVANEPVMDGSIVGALVGNADTGILDGVCNLLDFPFTFERVQALQLGTIIEVPEVAL